MIKVLNLPLAPVNEGGSVTRNRGSDGIDADKLQSVQQQQQFVVVDAEAQHVVDEGDEKDKQRIHQHRPQGLHQLLNARLEKRLVVVARQVVDPHHQQREDNLPLDHARREQIRLQRPAGLDAGEVKSHDVEQKPGHIRGQVVAQHIASCLSSAVNHSRIILMEPSDSSLIMLEGTASFVSSRRASTM